MAKLYNLIYNLCSERGITPGRLCNDLHLSRSMMTDLKSGRKNSLSLKTINKIADYFGVTTDYFFGRTNDPKEYKITNSDLMPDVMKPFVKSNTEIILKVDTPDSNVSGEEIKKMIEEKLKSTNIQDDKDGIIDLISVLPKEMQKQQMSLYDLFKIIGSDEKLLLRVKMNDLKNDSDYRDLYKYIQRLLENNIEFKKVPRNHLEFDDFTYAFYNQTKELTESDKQMLLEMAKMLKKKQDEMSKQDDASKDK